MRSRNGLRPCPACAPTRASAILSSSRRLDQLQARTLPERSVRFGDNIIESLCRRLRAVEDAIELRLGDRGDLAPLGAATRIPGVGYHLKLHPRVEPLGDV